MGGARDGQTRQPRIEVRFEDQRPVARFFGDETAGAVFVVEEAAPDAGDLCHLVDRVGRRDGFA